MEIKPLLNGEITLLLTDTGISYSSREFLALQICSLRLFMKIKFSLKFPNLQHARHFTLCLQVLSADNLSKQFDPRPGPTKFWA